MAPFTDVGRSALGLARLAVFGLPSQAWFLLKQAVGVPPHEPAMREDEPMTNDRQLQVPADGRKIRLVDDAGHLNPAAIGWSTSPLVDASLVLATVWRRKYWNYWAVTDSATGIFFAVTVADLDYAGLLHIDLYDRTTGVAYDATTLVPLGLGGDEMMPPDVHRTVHAYGGTDDLRIELEHVARSRPGAERVVRLAAAALKVMRVTSGDFARPSAGPGATITADIEVRYPAGHEQLHVVVPWPDGHFQYTAKHNTLPASGSVTFVPAPGAAPIVFHFDGPTSFACLDYGRGCWPGYSRWNWASFSGLDASGAHRVGVNLGGKWTDGTGTTENAVCVDGRLYRIHGPARWSYDRDNWMKPWTLIAPAAAGPVRDGAAVSLIFTPQFDRASKSNAVVVQSEVHQMFGTFEGTVTLAGVAEPLEIRNVFGWAEEHVALW